MAPSVSIVMPALNEEKNIVPSVRNTVAAFRDLGIEGEVIVVNDGSTDATADCVRVIAASACPPDRAPAGPAGADHVRLIEHRTPQGIGRSFWDGVDAAHHEIVAMFPGDNENDPWESLRYLDLLNHVDIVIPFVFNRHVRLVHRNVLSYLFRLIVNSTFRVNFNYTNGTVLYRRAILGELPFRSHSFFFQTDALVRLVKRGYLFAEVPYRLGLRQAGISKAISWPSFLSVARGYLRLVRDIYFTRPAEHPRVLDSATEKRAREEQHTTRGV